MNWLKRWRQKATNWLSDTPESFTSAFHEKKQMKERLEAALDQSTKRSGRAALVLAAAVILGLGGFAVWGISPTQKQTDTLRVLCGTGVYWPLCRVQCRRKRKSPVYGSLAGCGADGRVFFH